jgi:hypothetical protein
LSLENSNPQAISTTQPSSLPPGLPTPVLIFSRCIFHDYSNKVNVGWKPAGFIQKGLQKFSLKFGVFHANISIRFGDF